MNLYFAKEAQIVRWVQQRPFSLIHSVIVSFGQVRGLDFLRNLRLDFWWKGLFAFSSAMLALAFFTETKWISNKHAIILFGGMWLISLAEWKMEKVRTHFEDKGFGGMLQMSWKVRVADPVGVVLEVCGIGLILLLVLEVLGLVSLPSQL